MGMVSHLSRLPRNKLRLLLLPRRCWVLLILGGCLPMAYYLLSTTTVISIPNRSLHDLTSRLVDPQVTERRPPRLSEDEIRERFSRRRDTLQHGCQQYKDSGLFQPYKKTADLVSVNSHWPVMNVSLLYCPIQKVASTTWLELFSRSHEYFKEHGVSESPGLGKSVQFLFVREPYSRLLSAYVDKLLSPNTRFWKLTGTYVISNFRTKPAEISVQCGHDVTFPEYVRYVIHSQKTSLHRNGHFIPIHDHCDVCNEHYDYIGHLETLSTDMPYLVNVLQLPGQMIKNYDNDTIIDNARWVLKTMREDISKCMTIHEACLRLWKKWHIRGIISKTEPLPVSAEQAETISLEDFVELALQALARSRKEKSVQKEEAMREAFDSVPIEVRRELQDLFKLDFALFGFDPFPDTVFPFTARHYDSSYRYFELNEV